MGSGTFHNKDRFVRAMARMLDSPLDLLENGFIGGIKRWKHYSLLA